MNHLFLLATAALVSLPCFAHEKTTTKTSHSRKTTSSRPNLDGLVTTNRLDGPQEYTLVWPDEKLAEMEKEQREAGVFEEFDDLTELEMKMVLTINEWRKTNKKLGFLKVDPNLMKAARDAKCTKGHQVHGKWGEQRAREFGFKGRAWDNVAPGPYATPEDAVKGWGKKENSDWTHADQMAGYYRINGRKLNGHYNRTGVGVCPPDKNYVAFFGRLDSDPIPKK